MSLSVSRTSRVLFPVTLVPKQIQIVGFRSRVVGPTFSFHPQRLHPRPLKLQNVEMAAKSKARFATYPPCCPFSADAAFNSAFPCHATHLTYTQNYDYSSHLDGPDRILLHHQAHPTRSEAFCCQVRSSWCECLPLCHPPLMIVLLFNSGSAGTLRGIKEDKEDMNGARMKTLCCVP